MQPLAALSPGNHTRRSHMGHRIGRIGVLLASFALVLSACSSSSASPSAAASASGAADASASPEITPAATPASTGKPRDVDNRGHQYRSLQACETC